MPTPPFPRCSSCILGNGDFALSVIPIGPGAISIDPQANSYAGGTPITITATPNTNYTFLGWSGDASGTNNPLNIVLNQSQTIYANFSTNSSLLIYPVTAARHCGTALRSI